MYHTHTPGLLAYNGSFWSEEHTEATKDTGNEWHRWIKPGTDPFLRQWIIKHKPNSSLHWLMTCWEVYMIWALIASCGIEKFNWSPLQTEYKYFACLTRSWFNQHGEEGNWNEMQGGKMPIYQQVHFVCQMHWDISAKLSFFSKWASKCHWC